MRADQYFDRANIVTTPVSNLVRVAQHACKTCHSIVNILLSHTLLSISFLLLSLAVCLSHMQLGNAEHRVGTKASTIKRELSTKRVILPHVAYIIPANTVLQMDIMAPPSSHLPIHLAVRRNGLLTDVGSIILLTLG